MLGLVGATRLFLRMLAGTTKPWPIDAMSSFRRLVPMDCPVENRMMELGIDQNRIGSGDIDYGIQHNAMANALAGAWG